MTTYTVLGANGNIAQEVSKSLSSPDCLIKQFSRSPKKVNKTDLLISGNLLNAEEVAAAVAGSDVVFLLAGIQYSTKIWKRDWPIVMKNTLNACVNHKAKLVFFDNMYAFDPNEVGHLTEESKMAPLSEKGKVRKQILDMLWKEVKVGNLTALVARAADFYGPGASNSFLNELVIDKMKAGKSPQWLYAGDKKHSFTYIPDAGKATAFLAQQEDSWNQSWHLPTNSAYPSGKEIISILNKKLGKNLQLQILSPLAVSLLGIFISPLREIKELRYQSDSDYCFDSSKIEMAYGLKATPIEAGLEACL
jgi:nucleoside-diphosphate-sugar epimerase